MLIFEITVEHIARRSEHEIQKKNAKKSFTKLIKFNNETKLNLKQTKETKSLETRRERR